MTTCPPSTAPKNKAKTKKNAAGMGTSPKIGDRSIGVGTGTDTQGNMRTDVNSKQGKLKSKNDTMAERKGRTKRGERGHGGNGERQQAGIISNDRKVSFGKINTFQQNNRG